MAIQSLEKIVDDIKIGGIPYLEAYKMAIEIQRNQILKEGLIGYPDTPFLQQIVEQLEKLQENNHDNTLMIANVIDQISEKIEGVVQTMK